MRALEGAPVNSPLVGIAAVLGRAGGCSGTEGRGGGFLTSEYLEALASVLAK